MRFAFVSRHVPNNDQHDLVNQQNHTLHHVGDLDAFSPSLKDDLAMLSAQGFDGVSCVHPMVALEAKALGYAVGMFENASRAQENGPPSFVAKAFHVR